MLYSDTYNNEKITVFGNVTFDLITRTNIITVPVDETGKIHPNGQRKTKFPTIKAANQAARGTPYQVRIATSKP